MAQKRPKQTQLLSFFAKKQKPNEGGQESTHNVDPPIVVPVPSTSTEPSSTTQPQARPNDIGSFVNCSLSDSQRELAMKNVWVPPNNFVFPTTERTQTAQDGGKEKTYSIRFKLNWLNRFP